MLSVDQLAVDYRGVCGLEPISFTIPPGQLVGLIGPNGAGKSTLLKAMLGLTPAARGTVKFYDRPLLNQLGQVAYMPQRSQIDWDYPITVWQVAMMGRTRHLGWLRSPGRRSREIVQQALERVEIDHLRDRRISELSGGQQQRVFLARCLAQQADLLCLDEPFTGVDKKTEDILLEIFLELRDQGKILLVSNHHWGATLIKSDRLLLLNKSLIAEGTPQEVLTTENWQRVYGVHLPHVSVDALETLFFC
jgi:manganese/iron transport system ATP-binding protein